MLNGDQFLYRSVSRKLRALVGTDKYGPGAQLPSAQDLAKEFGVSTITIRRAIRDLILEGHLVGRQGRGVFVASRRKITRRLLKEDGISTLEDDLRKAGMKPSIQELDLTLAPSGDDKGLDRNNAGIGYRLDRIVLADDEPVALDRIWFPRHLVDPSQLRGHLERSIIQVRNSEFDHIDFCIEGSTATEEQAAFLKIVTGFPVLVIRFALIGTDGRPLFVGRTIARADRFEYQFRATPPVHKPK
ncbi:GntR family transcriptional regulator [Bradyrhizobium diversitatis]|uniref:GntR family transcriptional regulator n=1 Tax=Bradyrhizobium diversitatis TaxID=2755406 RepID=A0ABS0PG05_9BRAD|nr:GntR family transcriptional regulator [Bradyrhizobium diversitatis]MBH5392166.1 GntR family transcriptional regulator [Bradyrhizobium diversitatis]